MSVAPSPDPRRASDAEGLQRTAVVDLGSNSFRLVVFTARPGSWWRRTDEIHETVRIGAGLDAAGALQPAPMERALRTLEAYVRFCAASGLALPDVRAVATSAIRDASNREAFLERARALAGLEIAVLSREEEARLGYVAAVNSTALRDGTVLDLGGGSLQLVRVADRQAVQLGSWPLGAVRMTERFLPGPTAKKKQLRALRDHVRETLAEAPWLGGPEIVGLGGTLRNLAAAAEALAGLPGYGIQGFGLARAALDELVDELARRSPAQRAALPGIKPQRGDIILAGAVVAQAVLDLGGFAEVQTTEYGLREGVFLSGHLAPREPPLVDDVRRDGVRNLAAQYHDDLTHPEHVAHLAGLMWDELAALGLHPGDDEERELLWAAGMLHDVGVAVDYDDHHKHSRYLILSAGLPGFHPRETALIAQMARYHRKGTPVLGDLQGLMRPGDAARLRRGAALLRLAEQLERSRDGVVRSLELRRDGDAVVGRLQAAGDPHVAMWAAERHAEAFEEAFGRPLRLEA